MWNKSSFLSFYTLKMLSFNQSVFTSNETLINSDSLNFVNEDIIETK